MKVIQGVIMGAVLSAASVVANASIDLRVKGTIVPASCTPFLQGGGVVDYGVIRAEDLNETSYKVLDPKDIAFSINCDAATKVGVKAVDNMASSKIPGILEGTIGAEYTDNYNYGLGTTTGGKNIGGYAVSMKPGSFHSGGNQLKAITSLDDGSTWLETASGAVGQTTNLASWSLQAGPLAPVSFITLTGTLEVQAVINKAADLNITDEVTLDGLATLELRYL